MEKLEDEHVGLIEVEPCDRIGSLEELDDLILSINNNMRDEKQSDKTKRECPIYTIVETVQELFISQIILFNWSF